MEEPPTLEERQARYTMRPLTPTPYCAHPQTSPSLPGPGQTKMASDRRAPHSTQAAYEAENQQIW
ncbi:hypothetical protein CC78DRAFT_536478 [Lojkania enalia]|uniref:Uncharacterized protein n=1 Tax=Lojkania enalia TaxID=147567 RepID=A0A9P4MZH4_9PLEO|nr:hypothetical protein CC78DRAFT_536478 [Didymosphaeria enalia]